MTEQREADEYIKCSKCRSKYTSDDEHIKSDFGFNRLNKIFKTCVKCRSTNKINKINDGESNLKQNIIDYYVKLPLIKIYEKQEKDMRIDAIVVLNHSIEFEPTIRRYDTNTLTYKEFTKRDSINYHEGIDPYNEYMPEEFVTPVLIRIDGVTYRTSCLEWFGLTDCSDAIKLKQYQRNQEVYPIYVKQGQCPMVAIIYNTGLQYQNRLPGIEGFMLHQGYTDSLMN